MRTTINYERMMTKFQEMWPGNGLDIMQVAMILDASTIMLNGALRKKPTPNQVIEFSKVIATQLQERA